MAATKRDSSTVRGGKIDFVADDIEFHGEVLKDGSIDVSIKMSKSVVANFSDVMTQMLPTLTALYMQSTMPPEAPPPAATQTTRTRKK